MRVLSIIIRMIRGMVRLRGLEGGGLRLRLRLKFNDGWMVM